MILENEALTLAREALGDSELPGDVAFQTLIDAVKAGGAQAAAAEEQLRLARDEIEGLKLSRTEQTEEPNPVMLSLFNRSLKTQREQAITRGGITEACAKAIDALFLPGGKPTALALSRAGDNNPDPLISRLYDVLAENGGGLRHNDRAERFVASRTAPSGSARDGEDPAASVAEAKAEGEKWQKSQLAARGQL